MELAIQKAEDKLEYLSSDAETMSIYLAREKPLHDQTNMVNTAEKEEKRNTAKKMLLARMNIEIIESITELSRTEIMKLTY